MAITLELTRPKSVTTNTQDTGLSVGAAVETDTSSEESFLIPITLVAIDPPPFTVSNCIITNGSTSVTTADNGFLNARVGDAVSGSGISNDVTISAKTNNNIITLSANATAPGVVTLTINPPTVIPTVYALRVKHLKMGSVFRLSIDLMTYDGTLQGTAGTASNATKVINLVSSDGQPVQIDIDSFLTNLRVPKST